MLKLPDCAPGSFVVDLGCGNGALTEKLDEKADAIFSYAVFHWIDGREQEKLIANMARQLKPAVGWRTPGPFISRA